MDVKEQWIMNRQAEVLEYLRCYLRENEHVAMSTLAAVYMAAAEIDFVVARMKGMPVDCLKYRLVLSMMQTALPVLN